MRLADRVSRSDFRDPSVLANREIPRVGLDPVDSMLASFGALFAVGLPSLRRRRILFGGRDGGDVTRLVHVRVPSEVPTRELRAALDGLGEVAEVAPNHYRFAFGVPDDPLYPGQWGLSAIGCPDAWDHSSGSGVRVGVVDSGIDSTHPDLAPNAVAGTSVTDLVGVSAPSGYQFSGTLTPGGPPDDDVGHGTHVAGTIGAVTDNGEGVAGVAGGCEILPVRALARTVRDDGEKVIASGTAVDIRNGILWAVANGARVVNLSYGGPDSLAEADAVRQAVQRGVVLVAAVGNDGDRVDKYPAAYDGVVAVGAVDADGEVPWFSNRGPHVDLVAPGTGIESTWIGNGYRSDEGTSMAAAHVSGAVALLLSLRPNMTPAEVVEVLHRTSVPLVAGTNRPSETYGHGRIDVGAAVRSVTP